MVRSRREWLSTSVLAVAGLVCSVTAQAAVAALPGDEIVPVPQPGACRFCKPGAICAEHVS